MPTLGGGVVVSDGLLAQEKRINRSEEVVPN